MKLSRDHVQELVHASFKLDSAREVKVKAQAYLAKAQAYLDECAAAEVKAKQTCDALEAKLGIELDPEGVTNEPAT